mmetsp:Transcript_48466/g.75683  ORF Transcript_48466/g.75683 Transcript_48466/m.75683 type:complete len:83 (+) Transcript_48466:246-494(+)
METHGLRTQSCGLLLSLVPEEGVLSRRAYLEKLLTHFLDTKEEGCTGLSLLGQELARWHKQTFHGHATERSVLRYLWDLMLY